MFGFKPLKADRKALMVSSEDMEATEFYSMKEAPRAIGIGERDISMQGTMGESL